MVPPARASFLPRAVTATAVRYRPILPVGLVMVSVLAIVLVLVRIASGGLFGFDAYAYWRPPHLGSNLYGGTEWLGGLGVYRYAPAFAQLVRPLWVLDWPSFAFVWTALIVGTTAWCFGWRRLLIGMAIVMSLGEFDLGNVHVFLAAAIALGFRYPEAWSLVFLTKVTPGVGLLWFVVRGEWRSLFRALAATGAIVAASLVSGLWDPLGGFGTWRDWVMSVGTTQTHALSNTLLVDVPVGVRIVAAALLVSWGARTDRRWTVFAAAVLALPVIWDHGVTILIGIAGLRWLNDPPPWTVRGVFAGLTGRRADPGAGATPYICL
jgi:hypothetical protein